MESETNLAILSGEAPAAQETLKLETWDPAVFVSDVLDTDEKIKRNYEQISKSLTVAFGKGLASFQSYLDMIGLEPSIVLNRQLEEQKRLFKFVTEKKAEGYPPHLDHFPTGDEFTQEEIFQGQGEDGEKDPELDGVIGLLTKKKFGLFVKIIAMVKPIPAAVADFKPSTSFRDIMKNHSDSRKESRSKPSVGDLDEDPAFKWYSDTIFAQQSFTGINPTTIELARKWVSRFTAEAKNLRVYEVL